MTNARRKAGPFLFSALVLASILLLYTAYDSKEKAVSLTRLMRVLLFDDWRYSLRELNKVLALAGIGLASIAMAIGPLAVDFHGAFARRLWWRKPLGLTGFAFMALHALYAIVFSYRLSAGKMFVENDRVLGVVVALPALLIFLLMALTSNAASIRALGPARWKALHRLGYLALAFAVLHFAIMETALTGELGVRPYGLVFFLLPILTLVLKYVPLRRAHEPQHPSAP